MTANDRQGTGADSRTLFGRLAASLLLLATPRSVVRGQRCQPDRSQWRTWFGSARAGRGTGTATRTLVAPGLLVVLAALTAGPAAAQTDIVLVSNKGETPTANLTISARIAQGFSTGSNSAGYTLSRIDMVSNDTESDSYSVALYTTDSNGLPETLSVTLTAPGLFTAGVLSFHAPAGTTLAASTDYSLVITRGSTSLITTLVLDSTAGDDEVTEDTATGWSIADTHSTFAGSTWSNHASGFSLRVALKGYAKTTTADTTAPAFASAAANGASLVITFDEDLAAAASLANSAFTVKKTASGGSEATVALSTTVAPVISGTTVTLTLGTALVSTDGSVKVTYTKPTTGSANKLVDAASNETATFTDQTVTNNTPAVTNNAPVFDPAVVSRSVAENTADGQNVGAAVTATDADTGDTLAYTLGGADAASFDIVSTSGQIQTKTGVTYDHEAKASYAVTVTASDGTANAVATVTISVTDVIERASLSIGGLSNGTVAENRAYTSATPTLTGTPIGGVTWSKSGTDAADFSIDSDTGALSMVARNYEDPADANTDNVYAVTVKATDEDGNTATKAITVTVSDVQEAAAITVSGLSDASTAENVTWTSPTPSASGAIGKVTWSKSGTDAGDFGIVAASGVLTLAAQDFEDPADDDTDNVYEVTVIATDEDSNTESTSIEVTVTDARETVTLGITGLSNRNVAENAAFTSPTPRISGTPIGEVTWSKEGADAADFTMNTSNGVLSMVARNYEDPADANTDNIYAVTVKATDKDANTATASFTVTVTDVRETVTLAITGLSNRSVAENAAFTSPTPTLSGTPIGSVAWSKEGTDAADFTIDSSNGVLSMVARDFEGPADANTDNVYAVTVKATDDDGNTASTAITVSVTDVRESATLGITGLSNASTAENAAWTSPAPTLTGTPIGTFTWTKEGDDAAEFTQASNGRLTLSAKNFESPADDDGDNAYEVTVKATDADDNTAQVSITVTVTDVKESSTLRVSGLSDASTPENAAWTSPTPSVTGAIGSLTWSKSGTDADEFGLDTGTGALTLAAQDYEDPADANTDNVYAVTVKATDEDENTSSVSINVTVTDSAETATVVVSGVSGGTTAENAAWTSSIPSATGGIGSVTWSKLGADAAAFTLAANGGLTLPARDFEKPTDADTDNVYEVMLRATDADNNAATVSITVTVTDVTETATLTIGGLSNTTTAENAAWTSSKPTASRAIGSVTWSKSGTDAADFGIDTGSGVLTLAARDFESPADDDADNVYAVTVTATDADDNTNSVSITVRVTDVREAATLTITGLSSGTVDENSAYTSARPSLTGTPIGSVTWSKDGADTADFTIDSSNGVLSMVARDFEDPADANTDNVYAVTVKATDDDSNTASASVTVTVSDIEEAAAVTVTGLADASTAENAKWTSPRPTASGAIGSVTWSKSGTDAADFGIDTGSGVLTLAARDFESPADDDTDNLYAVTVTATDADDNTGSVSITVTVADVREVSRLGVTGLSSGTVAENGAYTSATPTLTGTPVGDVTWSTAGTDASDFTIDTSTGALSMVARDFETPVDADTDNDYEVTVKVTDEDQNTAGASIVVTVTDVQETRNLGISGLSSSDGVDENRVYTSSTPALTGTPIGDVTWSKAGTDASDFTIDTSTGALSMVGRDFEDPADADTDNDYEVSIKATDEDENTATVAITLTVRDVRETARLGITGLSNRTVAENAAFASPTPTLTGTPIGDVTWSKAGVDAPDFTIDTSTGAVSMVARNYESPVDFEEDNTYEVTVRATDEDQNTASASITVTVTDVRESATLAISGLSNGTVVENSAYTSATPTLTGTPIGDVTWSKAGVDAADFTIESSTGAVSMAARNFEDPVDANTDNVYAVSVKATDEDANTATASFTVTVTDAQETVSLGIGGLSDRSVAENTAFASPTPTLTGTPIGDVTWSKEGADAADFTIDSSSGAVSMVARDYENPVDADTDNDYEVTVKVTDADENTATASITVKVTDSAETSTLVVGGLSNASTEENAAWTSATPTLTGAIDTATWSKSGADADEFRIDSVTGVLTLSAQSYEDPADANGDNVYAVTVTATDSDGNTKSVSIDVTVMDVVETATLTVAGLSDQSVSENEAFSSATPRLTGTPIGDVTWTSSGTDAGEFEIDSGNGVLTLPAMNYESPADANGDNVYAVMVTATDADGNTATASITVSVTDVRETAVLGITGLGNTSVAENGGWRSPTPGLSGAPIGSVTWTLGGTDAGEFTIDGGTGVVSMAARDYEDPSDTDRDNDYELQVTVTDSDDNDASVSFTVTVADVAERSTVTIEGLADTSVRENTPWTSPTPSVTGAIGSVVWSRNGADAADYSIDANTGVLSLGAMNYESPADANTDNVYEVTVTATDDDANVGRRTVRITVTDETEVANLAIEGLVASATTTENVSWTSSAPSVANAIGTVTWSKSGVDADEFTIETGTGVLALPAMDYESPVDANGDNVYAVMVTATDDDGNTATVPVRVTVTDSAETSTVTIQGLADATTPENVAWTSPAPLASGAIGTVTWSKEGADADEFDLDFSGGILTLSARDYEAPSDADEDNVYEVTAKATDSDGNADTQSIEVRVTDLKEVSAVTLSGLSSAQVAENQSWSSPTPIVAGAIGAVTWSKDGADADEFTIDAVTGNLTLPAQDYESPADADRNNVYAVTVKATDADDNEGEQSIEVLVTDVDDTTEPPRPPPGPGGGGGGGGGGGAANHPPVVEREIEDQTLAVGEVLELDISLNFYDRDQRALDYSVESANTGVATVEVDRNGVLTIRGIGRGVTSVTMTAADRRDERASQAFRVTVTGPALVPLFPAASDSLGRQGFMRVINRYEGTAEVFIEAIDDAGSSAGAVLLTVDENAAAHFNSTDLEDGNRAKGLSAGLGPGEGDWRLILDSDQDFEALAYIRTEDGFLTSMHEIVPVSDGGHRVAVFNPGSNPNQVSLLRLVNPGATDGDVTITGIDDDGASPGTEVVVEVLAGQSVTVSASDLESGAGVDGALGDGTGKWRLRVASEVPIVAMSLLSSPTGHLTNLSTVPGAPGEDGRHVVPLFPSASDPLGRQGFVRAVNTADVAGEVRIEAYDDTDTVYEAVTLTLGAGQTVHFNSDDLELGNSDKGLTGSTGPGMGDWRLVLSSALEIDVLAYIRTSDGFLTSMHDVVPSIDGEHWVAIFNPGSNPNQVSRLRLVNPGTEDAEVTITGVDDAGASPGGSVTVTVPAGASRTIDAADLEAGAEGFGGALGDGAGKWRLAVTSEQPIIVMSLLSSPTGHLTNLSTAPDRGGI